MGNKTPGNPPFFDSLLREKELVMMTAESAMKSKFVAGVRVNGELAGIAGYVKYQRVIPSSFDVIASRFQGKGLGNQLHQRRLEFARKNYSFATSIIAESKNIKSHFTCVINMVLKSFVKKMTKYTYAYHST